jgi:hypothetical protein
MTSVQSCDILVLPSGPTLLLAEQRVVAQWPQNNASEPAYYRGPAGARVSDPVVLFEGSVMDVIGTGPRGRLGGLVTPVALDWPASACRAIPMRNDEILIGGPEGDLALLTDFRVS